MAKQLAIDHVGEELKNWEWTNMPYIQSQGVFFLLSWDASTLLISPLAHATSAKTHGELTLKVK